MRLLILGDSALIRNVTRLAFPSREHELQMPGVKGVAFIRALRQRPLHRNTPIVIATSGSESSLLLREARRLGVAGVAKKPWKPQELAAMVLQACAQRTRPESPSTMSDQRNQLSNADVRLLTLAEHGHTFRPADAAEDVFDVLVDHLRQLRDRGLLRLEEGRIMKSQRGVYLMAGPCDLTEAGRQALKQDRRLGPRHE